MKTSELIQVLKFNLKAKGDLEVEFYDRNMFGADGPILWVEEFRGVLLMGTDDKPEFDRRPVYEIAQEQTNQVLAAYEKRNEELGGLLP